MNKKELQSLLEGVRTALTGNQSKLDKNQNNKIDREDFTLLRSKKKPMAENADLLALLEHLYGVLLDEKAARLQEEKKRLARPQMESAEYDSILEKIYNLLAEEGVPPMLSPTDPNAIPLAPPPPPHGWPEQVGPWRPYVNPYLKNPHWINPDTSNKHRIKDPRGYPQAPPGWQGDWPWGPPTAPPSLGS